MKKKIAIAALFAALALGLVFYPWSRPKAVGQVGAAEIVLYTGENFTGRSLRVVGTLYDLPVEQELDGSLFSWNDEVRSLIVLGGTWRAWRHGRANTRLDGTDLQQFDVRTKLPVEGWSALISATSAGPLEVPHLGEAGLAGDISSLELISETNLPDWAMEFRK